jgi:ABC-2 type transport system ATP-binding protein
MTVVLQGLTIRYGKYVAVDQVDAEFVPGAVGLLGRNGAGKSSILRSLLGLVRPSILDLPEDSKPSVIRSRIGYMPERECHVPGLNGYETVRLMGQLSGLPRGDAARAAHEVLYLVQLDEQRYRPVSGYSAGMRQKIKLACALVHDPAVLFLDEPTNGLDPEGREEMLKLVRHLSRDLGKSVVLSTHILQDVEATCTAVVVLEKGRVVAQGALADLTRSERNEFWFAVDPPGVELSADGLGIELEHRGGGRWRALVPADRSAADLFRLVESKGADVRSLALHRRSLEEVFLGAVGAQPAEAKP